MHFVWLILHGWCVYCNNITINLIGIMNVNHLIDRQIISGQRIAIHMSNEHNNGYTYKLNIIHCMSPALCIQNISTVIKDNPYNNTIPIILGPSSTILTNAILPTVNALGYSLFSSGATSTILSNTEYYKYFYRSIPNDKLQGYAIASLCHMFGWNQVNILHVNNLYGNYLTGIYV